MSISYRWLAGLLVAGSLFTNSAANAQATSTSVMAPVPGQILSAKRVFVSNAGSESYGSETYFRLTRYDGGPDRFYNQLYSALKNWGRYELTDSPATADIVYEARFSSPIVDKQTKYDFTYDPQLTLTILDPKTRVALWSLTEHIQPGSSRESDNRNFDSAVDRIVEKTKMLVESPTTRAQQPTLAEAAPVGAIETAHRQNQAKHAAIGSAIGTLGGVLFASRNFSPCPLGSGASCAGHRAFSTLGYVVGGAISGAVVGWFWPTR
jgi:hypothetical protein